MALLKPGSLHSSVPGPQPAVFGSRHCETDCDVDEDFVDASCQPAIDRMIHTHRSKVSTCPIYMGSLCIGAAIESLGLKSLCGAAGLLGYGFAADDPHQQAALVTSVSSPGMPGFSNVKILAVASGVRFAACEARRIPQADEVSGKLLYFFCTAVDLASKQRLPMSPSYSVVLALSTSRLTGSLAKNAPRKVSGPPGCASTALMSASFLVSSAWGEGDVLKVQGVRQVWSASSAIRLPSLASLRRVHFCVGPGGVRSILPWILFQCSRNPHQSTRMSLQSVVTCSRVSERFILENSTV